MRACGERPGLQRWGAAAIVRPTCGGACLPGQGFSILDPTRPPSSAIAPPIGGVTWKSVIQAKVVVCRFEVSFKRMALKRWE